MDVIRRNKQIDSIKYLLLKCQDGSSLMSTVSSGDDSSKLDSQLESLLDTTSKGSKAPYQDQLLDDLAALSETRGRLREATLLMDSSMLGDSEQQLPGATLLSDLVSEIDQLGGQLARIGEHSELLGWRLLEDKFTTGLDLPYEQHGAVKSLLSRMAALISEVSEIELCFQKAAGYKPHRKTNEGLTKAIRSLSELRSQLENIQTLRRSCCTGVLAEASPTSASLLQDSEP
ncbi:uncharacterized protein LOC119112623 [Pollicipes pollicipes]|uniref:uncharacterized protein LOC119112623 n=1 Tax=Pollicipes pollicipes TaxID=41117 RepID=UPI0018859740|nr:uncharacterized protein LOC119112623 [Pollicipes pollicipes]XP_037092739.1 uncharacterized protein LOC119112623 [Pollicipes pollicipes]XP_037092740.1 uncharacterized protein LOC119112623 [Pollicipes pollicipes]XP_037092741.1 uncharacterized protein LOC119112623 [Pollicipes pollicipes]XP_037092742.1 uncharacterized protein LOC119112623 [Pollicipes pollicipes]